MELSGESLTVGELCKSFYSFCFLKETTESCRAEVHKLYVGLAWLLRLKKPSVIMYLHVFSTAKDPKGGMDNYMLSRGYLLLPSKKYWT